MPHGPFARTCLPAALGAAAGLVGLLLLAATATAEPIAAGGYSFSDELGGFSIHRVWGRGTASEPIVIEQRLDGTEPVILVIRRLPEQRPAASPFFHPGRWVAVHVRLLITNASHRVWEGFEVELQEILDKPSVREDGLSFDQGALKPTAVMSSRFAANHRLFEPYDRIRFMNGHVNPGDMVDFQVLITDPTPAAIFYLLMDPTLLSS